MFLGPQSWVSQGKKPAAAASEDAATTAWVGAVVSAGGAVSATQRGRVDTLIVALKSHGLFSANSRLWLHGGESDAKQATIDIMGLATATPQSSPTLAAAGYTGNGSSSYVDLGTKPSDYTQNSGTYGVYSITSSTTQDNTVTIGATDGVAIFADLLPLRGGGDLLARINRTGGNSIGAANANRKGLYACVSAGANSQIVYKNGSSFASGAQVSGSIIALPGFFVCARNNGVTADSFAVDQMAASFVLAAHDATQAANFSTDLNAYMTAWGINVY